ncbi:hypothetical protein BD289DRAFT_434320 [Coniella lustricola]|uniref:Uncharacterized protein n=1 Tax=Coniella lustricola TaxID=2025994 RepID=A0A2T3A7G8_9PEZI|nr:hypothetical protein BD289DRAFT_434320 [Coniella lustricola]
MLPPVVRDPTKRPQRGYSNPNQGQATWRRRADGTTASDSRGSSVPGGYGSLKLALSQLVLSTCHGGCALYASTTPYLLGGQSMVLATTRAQDEQ